MKKILQVVTFVFILLVIPMRMSNSTDMKLTPEEIRQNKNNIERIIIQNKIDEEFEAFYINLDSSTTACYVHDFFNKVMNEAIESKSLPSVSIAQAALETGYGRYNKLQNNLFGIKGRGITTYTKEYYKGRFITIRANFQYFPTIKDAFNRHYQILNRYGVKHGTSYHMWIDRIKACGYATDPHYDKKLKRIIKRFDLDRLDKIQKLKKQYNKIGVEDCNPTPVFTYNMA